MTATTAQAADGDLTHSAEDRVSLGDLASRYNFLNYNFYGSLFASVVIEECRGRGACRVLDIGCGRGVGRDLQLQWKIKAVASDYWGIEPDPSVKPAEGLFDHYQNALMETADLPAGTFDVAYSSMVMEHVADPVKFLSAVHRCLKPGGSYLFVTPNARSFVPRVTKWLHALKLDELALRLVRNKEEIDAYHYPVQYKCNSPRELDALARKLGFNPPEYAYFEGPGSHSYLRGPLAPIRKLLIMKRRLVRRPEALATLICRMTKAGENH